MLPDALIARHSGPFEWGVQDCVHFVADAVRELRGVSLSLPAYTGHRGAIELLAEADLASRVEALLGRPISPQDAVMGDIVLTAFEGVGQVVGVADPPVFWLRGENRVVPVEMNLAVKVYRCPRQ